MCIEIGIIHIDIKFKIGVSLYNMKSLTPPGGRRSRAPNPPRAYDMSNRAAQAEATRERIRQAAVALYRENALDGFTLEEVAQRAEVTVQTVLRAFKSKDQLIMTALIKLGEETQPIKIPRVPGDIDEAVTIFFDLYEEVGGFVIQQLGDEPRLPGIKLDLDAGRQGHANWVEEAFAPQLVRQSGEARARLFRALMVATDVYVWKLLRRDQKLDRIDAEAVMRQLINGVIRGA
jgi:AcrR family transcriptional regulator